MKGARPLTDSEIKSACEYLGSLQYPKRNQALFLLGVRTGFRISELLSLKIKDVFYNGRYTDRISVERKNMKKKTEGRTVVLHAEALTALQVWIEDLKLIGRADPDFFVFKSREGINKPMSRITAWLMLRKAFSACGFTGKLGTHCMRKTFAKKIYDKTGHDLPKTQKALGHASISSTVSYLSFDQQDVDDAILKS